MASYKFMLPSLSRMRAGGIRVRTYAPYVSPGGICCTLPTNFSALGPPIEDKASAGWAAVPSLWH